MIFCIEYEIPPTRAIHTMDIEAPNEEEALILFKSKKSLSAKVRKINEVPFRVVTEDEIYEEAITKWGSAGQIGMMNEECGELITALNRWQRKRITDEELASECADVMIMMRQLRMMLGPEIVDREIEKKLVRLKGRLGL